jgi:hypothetical protein
MRGHEMRTNHRSITSAVAPTLLALAFAASATFAAPAARSLGVTAFDAGVAFAAANPSLIQLAGRLAGGNALNEGSDGRFTLLLLGSDQRPKLSGERTDIVIVMTINPKTHQAAAVSIPRDISRLQRPAALGGGTTGRVNAIFSAELKKVSGTPEQKRRAALDRLRRIIEFNLQIEIDGYAMIRMTAFETLIDHIGGVNVNIPSVIKDPGFWDNPKGPRGIYFPPSASWALKGAPSGTTGSNPLCNGWYKSGPSPLSKPGAKCTRALVYVRTRKGAGNSDFKRTRRAQDVVASALKKVVDRGSGKLGALRSAAQGQGLALTMDPQLPSQATELFALASHWKSKGSPLQQAVLSPTKYAVRISGTATYRLKLAEVRALTKAWFGPVK